MAKTSENMARIRQLRPLPVHMAWANAEYAKMQLKRQDGKALLTAMFDGIKRYQDHPFVRAITPLPVIWRGGEARLYHAAAADPRAAVFIVPSMINRSHILDLLPGKSFVRYLAARGIDTFLLDWGEPAADADVTDMNAAIRERLLPALDMVRKTSPHPPVALGYCMGGTLLAGALALERDGIAGAAFLASPWDFHAGDRKLAGQVQMGTPAALQLMETSKSLPVNWIQSVFAAVNEERTVHKFAAFAAMDTNSEAAHLFVAVEDWLNDGLDLPAALARTCICDWYGDNATGRGAWILGSVTVDPRMLDLPALVVAPQRDRLVPADSAHALAALLPQATVMTPDCGHIGMMTGRSAETAVWDPVAAWILTR